MTKKGILAGVLALLGSWGGTAAGAPEAAPGLEGGLRFSMEVLVLSADGGRLYRVEDRAVASAGAEVGFNAEASGKKALVKAVGFLDEKGPGVRIVRESGAASATVLRLEDYASAVYELGRSGDRKMVLRVSAFIEPDREPAVRGFEDYQLRIGGRLIRNRTEVVLSGLSAASSGLIKATAPKLGTLRVSLKKFRGARPLGVVEDRRLSFSVDGDEYEWICDEAIAGPGRWTAWVRRDAEGADGGRASLGGAPLE